jgi:phytoene synthase
MDEAAVFAACMKIVRDNDPDRFFSALFAPAALRPSLFVLYAFNSEIARIGEHVREPMLGEIRLQWWRETVEEARAGRPRTTDIARGLSLLFARVDPPLAMFDEILDARRFDVSPDPFDDLPALEAYLDATSGHVMRLAARILGAEEGMSDAIRASGIAYGLSGIVRGLPAHLKRGRVYLPNDVLAASGMVATNAALAQDWDVLRTVVRSLAARAGDHLKAAGRAPQSKNALAAILPASLVPLYLRRLERASFDPRAPLNTVPIYRRQIALLAARARGRI